MPPQKAVARCRGNAGFSTAPFSPREIFPRRMELIQPVRFVLKRGSRAQKPRTAFDFAALPGTS